MDKLKNNLIIRSNNRRLSYILEYLKEYGSASRNDIESLLTDKLPDFMNAQQKYYKISIIIKELSQKENKIINTSGSTRFSSWKLVD